MRHPFPGTTAIPLTLISLVFAHLAHAESCSQQSLKGEGVVPTTKNYLYSRVGSSRASVTPFYQWENNYGYCGEVGIVQAGMLNGQWMSQFNARRICAPGLRSLENPETPLRGKGDQVLPEHPPRSYPTPLPWTLGMSLNQAGPANWCSIFNQAPNSNTQALFESSAPGISTGSNDFGSAGRCLSNSKLDFDLFENSPHGGVNEGAGLEAYKKFMSWIKSEAIAGKMVSIGILWREGNDDEYDHEVTVVKIGTNHSITDASYYDDDTLYIDDHGLEVVKLKKSKTAFYWPDLPPGASDGYCTPYVFGNTFAKWANSSEGARKSNAPNYSILIPPGESNETEQGDNGYGSTETVPSRNWGFAVSGPMDDDDVTKPIVVSIASTMTGNVKNPKDPIAGYNFENPMIGTGDDDGSACTNKQPEPMTMILNVDVSALEIGIEYNLYEYDFPSFATDDPRIGTAAQLRVPSSEFNKNATMASHVTKFVAQATTYSRQVTRSSDQIIVFRAVEATAP